jgi:hypothetical protein
VVLAYDYWKTQLGGAADVVGRKVLVNQHPMTVVGVAAATFRGIDVGEVPSLWIPASLSTQAIPGSTVYWTPRPVDASAGAIETGGYAGAGAGRAATVVCSDAAGGHPPPGFPKITPENRQRFLASTLELTPAPQGHSSLRRTLTSRCGCYSQAQRFCSAWPA